MSHHVIPPPPKDPNPPRVFGPCPKCRHADVGVVWRPDDGAYGCRHHRWYEPAEHFDLTCRTCQYLWSEKA